ncbi:putative ATP-dependent RNA helicase TDRD12 isoform X2 [Tiliqua scincoides]|uniref:putative ATP-dependent RNA helicase TDRD12 isoform X2 n=1 Tax=Tiliqua scincoides TaxID=71010 RepID=UPI003462CB9B
MRLKSFTLPAVCNSVFILFTMGGTASLNIVELHIRRIWTILVALHSLCTGPSPTNRWDVAAIQYFQSLLNATTQVEAKLCNVEEDSLTFDVYLYVTIKGEKVCVNDDLVAKNFAYYEMVKEKTFNTMEDQKKWSSLRPNSLSENINPALVLWPELLQIKESRDPETSAAATYDDGEKRACKDLQETTSYKGVTESDIMVAVHPLEKGTTIAEQADVQPNRDLYKKPDNMLKEMDKDIDEKSISVKLLQFLNPDPLKVVDEQDEIKELQLNISAHLPIVLSNKIEPCSSLEMAPLFPALKKELLRKRFLGPNHIQSYSWPPIARGCDSVIISTESDPLLYLLPILTFLQSRNCYVSLPARNGPLALVICPGQKKAEQVFELLEIHSHCSRPLHPILLLLGMKKEEIKNFRLPRGCEFIVTTPHSLVRLLEYNSFLFLRLCHLVFDEVEILFSEASKQMFNILEHYKNLNVEEREFAPRQIVAVGNHWNKNIHFLTKEYMNDPYIVITSVEEAAIYGNVQQVVQVCLECNRICTLLQILDFSPIDAQKTLIFTRSIEEADIVYKAVESTSLFCLKAHSGIGFYFDHVAKQWHKTISSGTHIVLVLTDDCLPVLGITDGTRVVHFSFPPSPRIFGSRLYSMSANFEHSVDKVSAQVNKQSKTKSILLLTEKNACHAVGVVRYLERTEAKIPPELYAFTAGVLEAKEDSKSGRPLCFYLKVYGVCTEKNRCPDRHRVNLEIDLPRQMTEDTLPTAGNVTILPLFIVSATNYFGRIVGKQKDLYATFAEEMSEYYKRASNRVSVDTVEKLAVYGLHEEKSFHRVQVLEVAPKEESCLFHTVQIKYIDEGRAGQVQNYHLLKLPEKFQALPPQAVEFIVCRVKPIDNEIEWNPKITRYINHKIRGKPHEAKIVLALGNTIWLDPVVRVTRLLGLKTSINEYNIRSEILCTGMGVDNPEHVQELQRLFRDAEMFREKQNLSALIQPLKHGTGEQAISVSQSILLNNQEQVTSSVQSAKEGEDFTNDCPQAALQNPHDEMTKNKEEEDEESLQPSNKCQVLLGSPQAGHDDGDGYPQMLGFSPGNQSFHPTMKWFQKQDVVVVKIKLQNITDYDCKFFTRRVIFSACAGGKSYLADMKLQENILKEKSTCVFKCDEPVIMLAKEKEEPWCNLLQHKNPNVSFDFDYLEDSEEKRPFLTGTGPKKVYQVATVVCEEEEESSEEVDTDSDDFSLC